MRVSNTQPLLGMPLNHSHPLSQGFVGCWLLNEGGGQIAVNSKGSALLNGGLTSGTTFKATQNGIGCNFTGSSYITIPDSDMWSPSASPNQQWTVSAWVRFDVVSGSIAVVSKGAASNYEWYIGFETTAGRQLEFLAWNAAGITATRASSNITPVVGRWYHLVATMKNTTSTPPTSSIYVNGLFKATDSLTVANTMANGTATLRFGNRADAVNFLTGCVNNVMIWQRALSATEVWQLYTNPYYMFQGYVPTLVGELINKYKFNNSGIRPRPFAPGLAR